MDQTSIKTLRQDKLIRLGLDPLKIQKHQLRIQTSQYSKTYKIIKFCDVGDLSILPLCFFEDLESSTLTMIPAAGAGSRFLEDEFKALKSGDLSSLETRSFFDNSLEKLKKFIKHLVFRFLKKKFRKMCENGWPKKNEGILFVLRL